MSKILCINNGAIYKTQSSIVNELGISRSYISHHLGGETPTVCGKVFIMINGDETKEELQKIISDEIKKRFNITLDLKVFLDGSKING